VRAPGYLSHDVPQIIARAQLGPMVGLSSRRVPADARGPATSARQSRPRKSFTAGKTALVRLFIREVDRVRVIQDGALRRGPYSQLKGPVED